jgi:hypothetical protein
VQGILARRRATAAGRADMAGRLADLERAEHRRLSSDSDGSRVARRGQHSSAPTRSERASFLTIDVGERLNAEGNALRVSVA